MKNTDWKAKSIDRTIENKKLKKRIKELIKSRDSWKEKSIENKARCNSLENSLKKTKSLIEKIIFQDI